MEKWLSVSVFYWRIIVLISIIIFMKTIELLLVSIVNLDLSVLNFYYIIIYLIIILYALYKSNFDRRSDRVCKKLEKYHGVGWNLISCGWDPEYHKMLALKKKERIFHSLSESNRDNFRDWFYGLFEKNLQDRDKSKDGSLITIDLELLLYHVYWLIVLAAFVFCSVWLIYC